MRILENAPFRFKWKRGRYILDQINGFRTQMHVRDQERCNWRRPVQAPFSPLKPMSTDLTAQLAPDFYGIVAGGKLRFESGLESIFQMARVVRL